MKVVFRVALVFSLAITAVGLLPKGFLSVIVFGESTAENKNAEFPLGPVVYDVRDEFALMQGGTNGLWNYGYSASDVDNTLTLFSPATDSDTIAGCSGGTFERWRINNGDTIPQIARHNPALTCSNVPSNAVFIHPGFGGQRAVVRWTAPVAGTFQLLGSLQRVNPGSTTDLKIIKNAAMPGEAVVFAGSNVSTYQITYNVNVTVEAGDKLDFSVGNGNGIQNGDGSSIVITISQPVSACLTSPANLQVAVPAENSPVDVQSVNTNASLVGDATYTNMGKVGRSFSFDGSGDYVRIEDNAAQRPATAVTEEGWFKFNSTSGVVSLISKPLRNTAYNSHTLYLDGGQLRGLVGNTSQYTRAFSNFSPQLGVWHHLAFTYSFGGGVSTLKLYANGVEVTGGQDGTPNLPLFYDSNPYPLLIGADFETNVPGFTLDGQADEVSVYDRALSPPEIFSLVKQGSFGKCPASACVQSPNNLVSWFAGEQNTLDSKSNNHGALQNGAAFGAGRVGQGFSFDGVDDRVAVPNSPSLDITSNQLTIEAWINPADSTDNQIVSMADGTNLADRKYGLSVSSNLLSFEIETANGRVEAVAGSIPVGTFTHVAGVYNGSQMIWYVNGNAVNSVAQSGNIVSSTSNFYIGQFAVHGFSTFNGTIDEVGIYNRGLTATEIQSIYNAGQSGKCKPAPLNPPTNQIAWFTGDGDTRDFLGLNPNGILRGDTNYKVGKVGQSFNLDGSGDYIEVADDADHRPANQLTGEGWFKFNNLNNSPHLIAKGLRGNDRNSYAMWYQNSNIRIGYADSSSNFISYDTGFSPNVGEFNHYALILNTDDVGANANTIKLYVNGTEIFSGAAANSIYYDTVNPHPLTIGADINNDVPDFPLNGQIDEVAVYSRAVTANEIAAIYNSGAAGKLKSASTPVNFARSSKTFESLAPTTVQLADAAVTFASVSVAGTTSQNGIDLGQFPPLPVTTTFTGLAYGISSTATYQNGTADDVRICFNLPALTATAVTNLRVLHLEGGAWVNRTATGNTLANFCTDNLSSLSPFVIVQVAAPTAANVGLRGRAVTADGQGIVNAIVTLSLADGAVRTTRTASFGYFAFENLAAGQTAVISIQSKRFVFLEPVRVVSLSNDVANLDFVAEP